MPDTENDATVEPTLQLSGSGADVPPTTRVALGYGEELPDDGGVWSSSTSGAAVAPTFQQKLATFNVSRGGLATISPIRAQVPDFDAPREDFLAEAVRRIRIEEGWPEPAAVVTADGDTPAQKAPMILGPPALYLPKATRREILEDRRRERRDHRRLRRTVRRVREPLVDIWYWLRGSGPYS